MNQKALFQTLTKRLTDNGRLVEAGFVGFRATMSPDVPEAQIDDMRIAFYAGAAHIFRSVGAMMDDGAEPSDTEIERMGKLNAEIERFEQWFKLHYEPAKGRA